METGFNELPQAWVRKRAGVEVRRCLLRGKGPGVVLGAPREAQQGYTAGDHCVETPVNQPHVRPLVTGHAVEPRHFCVRFPTKEQTQAIGNREGEAVGHALAVRQPGNDQGHAALGVIVRFHRGELGWLQLSDPSSGKIAGEHLQRNSRTT